MQLNQDYLCDDCNQHFLDVVSGLDSINLKYRIVPSLVRGLDYYTRTVFEIRHNSLGSQNAVCAGGRYDTLVKQLKGIDTPAIGFAFGLERLLIIKQLQHKQKIKDKKLIYLISLGKEADKKASKLLENLRAKKLFVDMDYIDRSLKAKMRQANQLNAKYCLIIGENELKKGVVILKDISLEVLQH